MRPAAALVSGLIAAAVLAGCSNAAGTTASSASGGGSDTGSGQALVSERCTRCHDVSRIKRAQHDKAGWEDTVGRMRGKGAQLSDAEAAQVIDFLAAGGASRL